MELTVIRKTKTDKSTIGDFLVDDKFFSYCLEDKDRGLTSDMSLDQIKALKVHGKTCIPPGRYQMGKYYSPKHGGDVPLVKDVNGFNYIEIHVGNKPEDTEGCLLLGATKDVDFVGTSKATVANFYPKFFAALEAGPVFITYKDA